MNVDITELIFDGRDNAPVVAMAQDGSPIDSTGISRTILKDVNGAFEIDTDQSPDALIWSGDKLTLTLGDQSINPGTYVVRIIIFDALNPDGLVIQHEASRPRLKLRFV